MCECNKELFTKEEYNAIISNDYEFCQGYYKNLNQNLIEYWQIHKQCCNRNNLEIKCETKECLEYVR